ncbi:RNA pseudouridine synthase [Rhodoferax sp.]|uniref:RNA pseudouridine synthase n=1 Tax=Rhodoferax sp. TaxID=50421 RepID=UPI0026205BD8|nr:RNA pseudouridine synthase [Rhodoferax sp.]MDD2920285.1 RNA pseudouridine synthase [Rhodoferax sp.]
MIKPHKSAPPPRPLSQDGERLSKRVAHLMHCSRREAEQYIEGGWVSVNGRVVEEPMARVTDQSVVVDPHASLMTLTDVTLLLHKPPGFETTAAPGEAGKRVKPAQQLLLPANHWAQDPSGVRLLKHHFVKLAACVPLEGAASGLVVFTQDWRVLRKLTEDAAITEHELVVEVAGDVAPEVQQRLNAGLSSDGQPLPPVKVSINSTSDSTTRLRFALKGAHPGLIAYLCERVGLHIQSIKRQRVGRVALSGLPEGQWRYLQAHERF